MYKNHLHEIINNDKNEGLDFVIHIQTRKELDDIIDVLETNKFIIQLSLKYDPDEIRKWMQDIGRDYNYDVCFRIRNRKEDRCVTFNPSVEHWRVFCNDIFEIKNGELEWNEGKYSLKAAKIEAKKIFEEMTEGHFPDFGECDLSKPEVKDRAIRKIEELVGFDWNKLNINVQ